MSRVIGELRVMRANREQCITLGDDYVWTCEDEQVERLLNESYRFDAAVDLNIGEAVVHTLYQVAARLGADVTHCERVALAN